MYVAAQSNLHMQLYMYAVYMYAYGYLTINVYIYIYKYLHIQNHLSAYQIPTMCKRAIITYTFHGKVFMFSQWEYNHDVLTIK